MRKKTLFIILSLLLTSLQGVLGWDGSGTSADPYLVRNSSDWETLSDLVNSGQATDGAFYRLMGDIAVKKSVGTSSHPFTGTFDGGGHAITASLSTASGIDTIRTIDADGTERYYDLDGRELPCKPERGIYILNGKKYISK